MNRNSLFKTKLILALAAAGTFASLAQAAAPTYQVQFYAPGVKAYYLRYFDSAGNPTTKLSFPTVVEGSSSAPVLFTLQNVGTVPLVFAATPFTVPSPFTLNSTTCAGSLAPAATCTATLTFSPRAAKTYSTQVITVNSTPGGVVSPPFYAVATTSPVIQVAAASHQAFVQKQNGTWWATGLNNAGQLGLGDTNNLNTFTEVPSLAGATKVFTGNSGSGLTVALFPGGVLKTASSPSYTFTPIPGITTNGNVVSGGNSTFVQLTDGSWVGNGNFDGALGLGDFTVRSSFVPLTLPAGTNQIVVTGRSAYAKRADGVWLSAGYNSWGQLGLGDSGPSTNRSSFTVIPGLPANSQLFGGEQEAPYAKLPGGSWAAAGNDIPGNFGDGFGNGVNANFINLVNIGAATTVFPTFQGLYAKYADGTVFSAGYAYGLPYNDYGHSSYFRPQLLLKDAVSIVGGYDYAMALMPDGTLMVGGLNYWGELGTGDNLKRGYYGNPFVKIVP